ncbi:G2/mitotic-specific cyclin-1-like [Ipomoea triloba]|uniref:G2/mitotic-specific cyclin-1-like n=1 Tax=Ipomoea triloba TaxID=35885 RepID=UPI00125DC24F|nr:G2/mitotic-specific cyclin-1-like [Ipomoea triloba]
MEVPRKSSSQKRATVKPIKPEPKEKVKEKNNLRRRAAAEGSSRKTYTATLTARRRAACGLNIKLPKEKIEDIDAGDVYNELAVVEYAEDIYKEAKSTRCIHITVMAYVHWVLWMIPTWFEVHFHC